MLIHSSFCFNSVRNVGEECGADQLLRDDPFFFDNCLFVLKKWCPRMNLDVSAMLSIPIWIQFLGLPWEFWTTEMLSRLGSFCERPLYCDKCTLTRLRLGYARILVDMEIEGDFLDSISLQDENGQVFHKGLSMSGSLNFVVNVGGLGI